MMAVNGIIAPYLDKGGAVHNVKAYGAMGDGSTNDLAALQAANDAARLAGVPLFIPAGEYVTDDTLEITGDCLVHPNAKILYGGTGVAVHVRPAGDLATSVLMDKYIETPQVVDTTKPGFGSWSSGTVGVKVSNVQNSILRIQKIENFETGLWVAATSLGCAYNTMTLMMLYSNMVNMLLEPDDASGWVNENNFIGGRFAHRSGEGTDVSGTRQIVIGQATSVINNNSWFGPSLEGPVAEYRIECYGRDNYFFRPRFEGATAQRIWYRAVGAGNNAQGNVIFYGRGAQLLEITEEAGCVFNSVYHREGMRISGGGQCVMMLQNDIADNEAVLAAFDSGTSIHGKDVDDDYKMRVTANNTDFKDESDVFPRIRIAHETGQIRVGDGTELPPGIIDYDESRDAIHLQGKSTRIGSTAAWNSQHLILGTYHLWVDTSGNLRIKNGAPSSDTDGTVVGAQT